jgi:hypothetical protein
MAMVTHVSPYTGDVNDWALETRTLGPFAAATLVQNTSYGYFMITQPMDIEKITLRVGTAATNAAEVTFKVAAPGTAIASGTAITALETINLAAFVDGVEDPHDVPFLSTAPQINLAAGTVFGVTVSNAQATTGLVNLYITVTLRKAPDRRDITSDTTKVDKTKYFYTKK